MEPLPRGANFQRALMLWEIGLHIAGNPNTPYYGPRDMNLRQNRLIAEQSAYP